MTLRLDLPGRDVAISQWKRPDTAAWTVLTERAEVLRKRLGRGAGFSPKLEEARRLLDSAEPETSPLLDRRDMRRAVMTVWSEDRGRAQRTLRAGLLDRVAPADTGRSTLLTLALAQIYYEHFDQLDEWDGGLFAHVGARLTQLAQRPDAAELGGVFTALNQHSPVAAGQKAPQRIAHHVITADEHLEPYLERIGLGDYSSGRFMELVRQHTYLARIEAADPQNPPPFLRDLTEPSLYNASSTGSRRFGHLIIVAMARTGITEPHRDWLNTVLDIAGDPRARGTEQWNRWWSLVDEAYRRTVLGWLTSQDLTLFLDAVQELGEREGKEDLLRMFPARKTLLKGLHREGRIRETRLLAAKQARRSLRLSLAREIRSEITRVTGTHPDLSVIYLDCGDFHIVEGSHSFALQIFVGGPPRAFGEWSTAAVDARDLRAPLDSERTDQKSLTHYPNNKWISDTLVFLADHGTYVPPPSVMDDTTYRQVKKDYVLPERRKGTRA